MFWKTIGDGVISIVGSFFETRKIKAEGKIKLETVKVESMARIAEARATAIVNLAASEKAHEQNWERILVEQSGSSWKDEMWTVILAIPLVMAFVPGLAPHVMTGFENLTGVPTWYLVFVSSAIGFAFGIRSLTKMFSIVK